MHIRSTRPLAYKQWEFGAKLQVVVNASARDTQHEIVTRSTVQKSSCMPSSTTRLGGKPKYAVAGRALREM